MASKKPKKCVAMNCAQLPCLLHCQKNPSDSYHEMDLRTVRQSNCWPEYVEVRCIHCYKDGYTKLIPTQVDWSSP